MVGLQGKKQSSQCSLHARNPAAGLFGTVVGLMSLLFGASGVFCELRSALNTIWDVAPEESKGFRGIVRDRFFSFGMVLGIGFLLTVSLVVPFMWFTAAPDACG